MQPGQSKALQYVRKYYPEVTKVVDAKRGTKITVTKRDCENGVSKAPNICAIAKAAMRRYDGAMVSLSRAYLVKGNVATRYQVPGHVTRELIVFDRAHAFQPGVYELNKPTSTALLERKRPAGNVKKARRTGANAHHRRHMPTGVRVLG